MIQAVTSKKNVNIIRQSALSTYKNYWDENQIGGSSWNTLFSSGASYDLQTEVFHNSNNAALGVASIVTTFFDVEHLRHRIQKVFSSGRQLFDSNQIGNEKITPNGITPIAEKIEPTLSKERKNERRMLTALDASGEDTKKGSLGLIETSVNTEPSQGQKRSASEISFDPGNNESLGDEIDIDEDYFLILSSEGELKTTDIAKERALTNLLEKEWSTFDTNTLFSFPYVPDDAKRSLHFNPQSMNRRIPSREKMFIDNAKKL